MGDATFQPVNVRLPDDLHRAAIERADQDDRTLSSLIRVALRYYLANASLNSSSET